MLDVVGVAAVGGACEPEQCQPSQSRQSVQYITGLGEPYNIQSRDVGAYIYMYVWLLYLPSNIRHQIPSHNKHRFLPVHAKLIHRVHDVQERIDALGPFADPGLVNGQLDAVVQSRRGSARRKGRQCCGP
jgi:hypothetical protein